VSVLARAFLALDLFLQLTQVRLDKDILPDFVHENVWDDDDLEVSW
jgi:hypothetical protein